MNTLLNNLWRSVLKSYLILLTTVAFFFIGAILPIGCSQALSSTMAEEPLPAVLFKNVRIFNGIYNQLYGPADVLVVGNKIQTISTEGIPIPSRDEYELSVPVIDGDGRVLMPGLTDAHFHFDFASITLDQVFDPELSFEEVRKNIKENAKTAAEDMLMRGFTTGRDAGGNVFELKQAIDAGEIAGPRIYPSGPMISQTSGHADFRPLSELPRTPTSELSLTERLGETMIADGVPEVLRRVREQLMKGASQIKISMGGGVASAYDPIDVAQYTDAEIRAAVDATTDWNTYVMVHAYTPVSIQRSIRAGVKSIEHGNLLDEETAKLMAEKATWLSIQPFVEDDAESAPNPEKFLEVAEGTDKTYKLAKKYHLKTAFGTDIIFDPDLVEQQGAQLLKLLRWYSPVEILKMATSVNGELFALSGPRNPYPGKLGVLEEGALADLLLVDGNPLEDIGLITNPEENFIVIMKDGKICKSDFGFTNCVKPELQ